MIYLLWGLAGLVLVATVAAAVGAVRARGRQQRAMEERRKRYTIKESGERIPMAPERVATEGGSAPIAEIAPPRPSQPSRPAQAPPSRPTRVEPEPEEDPSETRPPVLGRLVDTPEGEMILTTPPFALRDALFGHKVGRFVNALNRRVPAWIVVCPRVRLDTLVVPTAPDGRDPSDWREWRKRVRLRALDLVLCDRRTWRPLVAVLFDTRPMNPRAVGGGRDRMTDEVLAHVGLPLLHLTGDIATDWSLIQPYVEESILRHVSEEELLDASQRAETVDADSAGTLLRMDSEKGWVLE